MTTYSPDEIEGATAGSYRDWRAALARLGHDLRVMEIPPLMGDPWSWDGITINFRGRPAPAEEAAGVVTFVQALRARFVDPGTTRWDRPAAETEGISLLHRVGLLQPLGWVIRPLTDTTPQRERLADAALNNPIVGDLWTIQGEVEAVETYVISGPTRSQWVPVRVLRPEGGAAPSRRWRENIGQPPGLWGKATYLGHRPDLVPFPHWPGAAP